MIITRSPLRISLGGGGTDLPSYYQDHSGFLIAAAIDKYVYITLHRTFVAELIIKYSKMERVKRIEDVQHPIIRECLKLTKVQAPQLEMTSMADIPAGTGLGSSGSFTTALLKALHTIEQKSRPSARAGRAGMPYRNRHPRGTRRKTRSIYSRFRRDYLLPVFAQWAG